MIGPRCGCLGMDRIGQMSSAYRRGFIGSNQHTAKGEEQQRKRSPGTSLLPFRQTAFGEAYQERKDYADEYRQYDNRRRRFFRNIHIKHGEGPRRPGRYSRESRANGRNLLSRSGPGLPAFLSSSRKSCSEQNMPGRAARRTHDGAPRRRV